VIFLSERVRLSALPGGIWQSALFTSTAIKQANWIGYIGDLMQASNSIKVRKALFYRLFSQNHGQEPHLLQEYRHSAPKVPTGDLMQSSVIPAAVAARLWL